MQLVHEKINSYRISHGLRSLVLDAALTRLAEEHSRRMATGQVPLGHAGFDERAQRIGRSRSYRSVGENVGYNWGQADPAAAAVERWLRSPEHLANIKGDFELTGIGIASNDKGEYYFTQIFLKPSR